MIKKLKTNSKIFCFCENKPKCVSLLVHWSWLLNFNTNLTCFTFSPWYLPLICWRSLIFETKYPYFGRIVPFLVFLLHFWYFSFKFGTALRYLCSYRSRFLILKIRKKILTKCIRCSCLSEKEVIRLGLRRCDQALLDSRYLGQYSSIWRFKKNHVRIFFCEFLLQVNDVRSWHEQFSECQCILGWWWLCRVRCLHEGHKVC